MSVNKKSFIYIPLSILLVSILAVCMITGCNTTSFFTSSISGVISVPITGVQHYEESDFGNDFASAKEIEYEDTAHGTIGTSDDVDYFKFSGYLGDSVIIDIDAEAIGSGLDSVLYLYDSIYSWVADNDDYPPGTLNDPANYIFVYDSHIETVLDSDGDFYIVVSSYGGLNSGSYQLRLFKYSSEAASAQSQGAAAVEFVPDEIIVKYRPGFSTQSVKSMGQAGDHTVLKSNRDSTRGALELLRLESARRRLESEGRSLMSRNDAKKMTLAEVRRLRALPYVEYAEPNYIMKPLFDPNDNYLDLQWHYPLIKLDMVWDENLVNDISSVIVAVIDTGIARSNGTSSGSDHPDLEGIFVDEYDFITDTYNSLDGDGIDSDATDPGDDPNGQFSSFHGTHVIGTIGALTHNVTGIAGVAGGENSGVKIMPLRALGASGGFVYDIAQAVLYAAGLPNDSPGTPSQIADIINMSLGAPVDTQTLRNAVSAAYSAGTLIVASAGNEGTSTPFYPAAYENVISVSAVGPGGELAPYSSFGGTVDISAPGGDLGTDLTFDGYPDGVLSTLFDHNGPNYTSTYAFYQGTSMAAPHVSGVAALLLAADGTLTLAELKQKLTETAIDLGQVGKDPYYGYGLVNAYAAVKSALDEVQNPVLWPFPRSIKLEGSDPTGTFTLKNIGGAGTIEVNSISVVKDPATMVSTITPAGSINLIDTQDVEITLNTSGIKDGKTYYAKLEILYDTSKTEYMYVLYNSSGISSFYENEDVGYVFVVAIDPDTYKTVAQYLTTYNWSYTYKISGLPAGSYVIAAGTDRDNDLGISDAGEASGFYPVYGSWVAIDVEQGTHLTGIDFQVIDNTSAGLGSFGVSRKTVTIN